MKKSELKQMEILEYLNEYIKDYGYPPSYREISAKVGLKSTNSIKRYLDVLENNGLITRLSAKSRTIDIVKNRNDNIVSLPVVAHSKVYVLNL